MLDYVSTMLQEIMIQIQHLLLLQRPVTMITCLYDSDLVGHVQSIIVCGETNVGFLESMRSDERIHFCNLDVVKFLDSEFDLWFTRSNVADEHQGVVIFNLLHRTLRRQRVTDHRELIHPPDLRCRLPRIQTRSCQL